MKKIEDFPLISIIVPVYNVEEYLSDCVTSLVEQTYKKKKIILIDDGSTDSSSIICDNFACKDSRVTVIHKKNEGVAVARNTGIKLSKGDFITFVDADDYILQNTCHELVEIMTKNELDMISFNHDKITTQTKEEQPTNRGTGNITKMNTYDAAVHYLYGRYFTHSPWGKLFKRDIVINTPFPKGMLAEDYAIMYKLIENCTNLAYYDRSLYMYRIRNGSIMTSNSLKLAIDTYHVTCEKRNHDLQLYKAHKVAIETGYVNCLLKTYVRLYKERSAHSCSLLSNIDKQLHEIKEKDLRFISRAVLFLYKWNKSLFLRLMQLTKQIR